MLAAPLLLTACIGSSRLCLAYESERRILLGMQISCSTAKKQPETQQLNDQSRNITNHEAERVTQINTSCIAQKTPTHTSRFHRGAGLASLFRELGRVPSTESISSASATSASTQSHPKLSWNSEVPSKPRKEKRLEDVVIQFASMKLPHVSAPTALLYYVQLGPYETACSELTIRRDPSVNFLSLAAEGYILSWRYNVSHCSADLEQTQSTTNHSGNQILSQFINSKREGQQTIQPCYGDGKENPYSYDKVSLPECVQSSTATLSVPSKNTIDQAGSALGLQYSSLNKSGTFSGNPKDAQLAGTAAYLPPGYATSCDDNIQERA